MRNPFRRKSKQEDPPPFMAGHVGGHVDLGQDSIPLNGNDVTSRFMNLIMTNGVGILSEQKDGSWTLELSGRKFNAPTQSEALSKAEDALG